MSLFQNGSPPVRVFWWKGWISELRFI
jgi:hypothetical protein